jgi:hypothetical protein
MSIARTRKQNASIWGHYFHLKIWIVHVQLNRISCAVYVHIHSQPQSLLAHHGGAWLFHVCMQQHPFLHISGLAVVTKSKYRKHALVYCDSHYKEHHTAHPLTFSFSMQSVTWAATPVFTKSKPANWFLLHRLTSLTRQPYHLNYFIIKQILNWGRHVYIPSSLTIWFLYFFSPPCPVVTGDSWTKISWCYIYVYKSSFIMYSLWPNYKMFLLF